MKYKSSKEEIRGKLRGNLKCGSAQPSLSCLELHTKQVMRGTLHMPGQGLKFTKFVLQRHSVLRISNRNHSCPLCAFCTALSDMCTACSVQLYSTGQL